MHKSMKLENNKMKSSRGFLLCLLVAQHVFVIATSALGSVYSSHIFHRYTVTSGDDCMTACAQTESRCASFRVKVQNSLLLCELNECDLEEGGESMAKDVDSLLRLTRGMGDATSYTAQQIRQRKNKTDCSVKANMTAYKTCSDIKLRDASAPSGYYVIDPDVSGVAGGQLPFEVFCDMSDLGGVGVTLISHDSEARTYVRDGVQIPGSFSRNVTYKGASLAQLAQLTKVSLHCKQFIKWECYDTMFFHNGYAWWVSRDNQRMDHWGGAVPGSGKCACGMTSSCIDPSFGCNCDVQGQRWLADEGYLTNKTALPVRQMRFGDFNEEYERGYYTLGKLKCYGNEPIV